MTVEATTPDAPPEPGPAQTPQAPMILVVDDDLDILDMMCIVLEHAGYRTARASHGRDALDLVAKHGREISLILLDVMMPVMNGLEFRQSQREMAGAADIPVVVVSGDGNARASAEQAGAAGFMRKPLDLGDLLATVERYRASPGGLRSR